MTLADRYAEWLTCLDARVRESGPPAPQARSLTEIEVQARWFSGEFGRSFRTVTGESVEIVQFGEWNREAGPDFHNAAITINGAAPVLGCIELDPDVRDWERHGHSVNPAYDAVVLHVYWTEGSRDFFTRSTTGRSIPQVKLLLERVNVDRVDFVPNTMPGRCVAPLAAMGGDKLERLLSAAAHYRMVRKSKRIARASEAHGESEAVYQCLAETLGYKLNKLPFLLLAQRFPAGTLRKNPGQIESLLFGASGFLTSMDLYGAEADTKDYLRGLWDGWWERRGEVEKLAFLPNLWRCGGMRPMNHPHRRVGALAEVVRAWPKARDVLRSADFEAIHRFFSNLSHPYWDHHYTLTSKASVRRMALIGAERINGILMNVAIPLAMRDDPSSYEGLQTLVVPDFNLKVKKASFRFFGTDARCVPLLKTAMCQQGLLQIYDDFCCLDASDCRQCPLIEQIGRWL